MNTTIRWSFTIFHNGVRTRSPRLFDKKEDALQAIVEKLAQDALDGQYPSVGLVVITIPQVNKDEQTNSRLCNAAIPRTNT